MGKLSSMTALPLIFPVKPHGIRKNRNISHIHRVLPAGEPPVPILSIYIHPPQESGTASTGNLELVDQENHIWKYRGNNGAYAKDGWIYVYNPYSQEEEKYSWLHFDKNGVMTYGWYKAEERIWYYCHEVSDGSLGKLVKGWHEDSQDGKIYFLNRKTGIMLSGWQGIDGCWYYFATLEEIPQQTWMWKVFDDSGLGKWIYERLGYRSYGPLYVDGRTLDGQRVYKSRL